MLGSPQNSILFTPFCGTFTIDSEGRKTILRTDDEWLDGRASELLGYDIHSCRFILTTTTAPASHPFKNHRQAAHWRTPLQYSSLDSRHTRDPHPWAAPKLLFLGTPSATLRCRLAWSAWPCDQYRTLCPIKDEIIIKNSFLLNVRFWWHPIYVIRPFVAHSYVWQAIDPLSQVFNFKLIRDQGKHIKFGRVAVGTLGLIGDE